ncbi:Sensor histidine kinase RcsC [Sporomusa rhizae]|uniref:sensor histidine kinase n=1 Tax=Sporomusa rhizae TaxID=357999 RepID=UPI00352BCFAD
MFQRLRLRLTLINVVIILTLFLLLIGGAYFFSKANITHHTESISRKLAADIHAGLINDWPPHPPPGNMPRPPERLETLRFLVPRDSESLPPSPRPDFFFVKTLPDGSISFQSSGQPLAANCLMALTQAALTSPSEQATVTHEQTTYSYCKTPLMNQNGTLIVFHDLTPETNMLHLVIAILIAVGFCCSFLSFGASFYMTYRAIIPIKQAWQQQRNFLSDVSHELRTPLSIIQTNLEIIKLSRDETVASQDKWIDNIQEESLRTIGLVNDLLFLARADSERQPLHKQSFSLDTALRQVAAPFEAVTLQKGLFLKIKCSAPLEFYGDEARIKQVIAILLDNAIRHTLAGGIIVSLEQTNSKMQISVTDSGEGIEPEYLDKIFDRFYQIDKSRNKGSSGLGLAIAKWIIEKHDGSITVTSSIGIGTTFTVELPINKHSHGWGFSPFEGCHRMN